MHNVVQALPAGVSIALAMGSVNSDIAVSVKTFPVDQTSFTWSAAPEPGAITVASPWLKELVTPTGHDYAYDRDEATTLTHSRAVTRFGSISAAAMIVGVLLAIGTAVGLLGSGASLAMSLMLVVAGLAAARASSRARTLR